MNTHKAIKAMIKLSDLTQDKVSVEIGRSKFWLGSTFHAANDSRAGTVAEIAEVCGYSLALIPKKDVPPSALVIAPEKE